MTVPALLNMLFGVLAEPLGLLVLSWVAREVGLPVRAGNSG
jgi:hypothetical protein